VYRNSSCNTTTFPCIESPYPMARCWCLAVCAVVSTFLCVYGNMSESGPDSSDWGVLVKDDSCSSAGGHCSLKLLQKNVHQEAHAMKSAKSEQSSPQKSNAHTLHLETDSAPQQGDAGEWNSRKMEQLVPPPRHPALSSHGNDSHRQLFAFLQNGVKTMSEQRTNRDRLSLQMMFMVIEFSVLLSIFLCARVAAPHSSGPVLFAKGHQDAGAQQQGAGDTMHKVPLAEEKPYQPQLPEVCNEEEKATTAPMQEADTSTMNNK